MDPVSFLLLRLAVVLAVLASALGLGLYWHNNPVKAQHRLGTVFSIPFKIIRKAFALVVGNFVAVGLLVAFIPLTVLFVTLKLLAGERPRVKVKLSVGPDEFLTFSSAGSGR